jgi:UDP-glucose 6-dehydrogenase
MKATVIGTGSIGLGSGACVVAVGNDVLLPDQAARKIGTQKDDDALIRAPGLLEMAGAM